MQQGWCIGRRLLVQLRANNHKAQLRFRYAQENSNKQELRIVEEGDDLQSKLKEALRS